MNQNVYPIIRKVRTFTPESFAFCDMMVTVDGHRHAVSTESPPCLAVFHRDGLPGSRMNMGLCVKNGGVRWRKPPPKKSEKKLRGI